MYLYRALRRLCETFYIFLCLLPLLSSRALPVSRIPAKMEKLSFDYSTKDIPIPPLKTYKIKLLDKVESVLKRMRWKAFFFLNPSTESRTGKFNLKSRRCPPPIEDLKPFEDDMFKMIESLRFKEEGQKQLSRQAEA